VVELEVTVTVSVPSSDVDGCWASLRVCWDGCFTGVEGKLGGVARVVVVSAAGAGSGVSAGVAGTGVD
jgi:hypothetical protein